jgi:hypothetical protein
MTDITEFSLSSFAEICADSRHGTRLSGVAELIRGAFRAPAPSTSALISASAEWPGPITFTVQDALVPVYFPLVAVFLSGNPSVSG